MMNRVIRPMRTAGRTQAIRPDLSRRRSTAAVVLVTAFLLVVSGTRSTLQAAPGDAPTLKDPKLTVKAVVTGLDFPTGLAFLGPSEMLVLEKNTGRVLHVVNGAVTQPVLDLAVNSASERGLLGIALDPGFATNHFVYLYWTNRAPHPADPFIPSMREGADPPELGADSADILEVPLLGNRIDRFVWNGTTLTFDRNLIKLRAFQNDGAPDPPNQGDAAEPPHGNHNGGAMRFGPDGKLYLFFGDNGRRGQMQNLPSGPTPTGLGPTVPDDQFGGPQPDNAHFSGVILRLNPDGTPPADNPFFIVGAGIGGEAGTNLQKVFAYGVRNSFGIDFDPVSGALWDEQNGDDSFDEINRIEPGMNGGWVQIMGPAARLAQFKQIETTFTEPPDQAIPSLQQLRWPPTNIASTPEEAMSRLFMLPGAHYKDPEFSWVHVIALAGLGFMRGDALGPEYANTLWLGTAEADPMGGVLFRFRLTGDRQKIAVDDPRLEDRVADNMSNQDLTESESLLIGTNFGIVTHIETGPNGNLFVLRLTDGSTPNSGAIFEIARAQ
jgi:aldose sugar dehydrogenase